ncbi:glycoside hydrolase family 66 protein [Paenibacillus roseipurpureus]|uniref:Glycoside hydrolase family 66 protein n=1 Tax=Paenibacillus roseopurpureus TaxID=2918901 RepID=A0AA96RL57_9BACL|nr:glycoside hydrolase family 66 protein [Paenibacillus sp. MBLB1832]
MVIEIANPTDTSLMLNLGANFSFLEKQVEVYGSDVWTQPFEITKHEMVVAPKDTVFNGYGVDVFLYEQNILNHEHATSFDVVSNWRKSIRYGFLSDFNTSKLGVTADVAYINKLHLNVVQFYDWMYKHDDLILPLDKFRDLMGMPRTKEVGIRHRRRNEDQLWDDTLYITKKTTIPFKNGYELSFCLENLEILKNRKFFTVMHFKLFYSSQ